MKLVDAVDTGPARRFGDAHVFYMLHILFAEGRVSRSKLADVMGIGEGSVRNILKILRGWGMVDVDRTGVSLNEKGIAFLLDIDMRMVDVPRTRCVRGSFHQGVVVSGAADRITDGMRQRDRGIIAGATGASVFLMRDGTLVMPSHWNMDCREPDFSKEVYRTGIIDGDVLVVSGASERGTAAVSAIAIGLDLLRCHAPDLRRHSDPPDRHGPMHLMGFRGGQIVRLPRRDRIRVRDLRIPAQRLQGPDRLRVVFIGDGGARIGPGGS